MKKYIFVFGRNPKLSYAELLSYFRSFNFKYKLEYSMGKVAVFFVDKEIDISKLGGTVKVAEVILENEIKDADFYLGSKNKINYAISSYNDNKYLSEFEGFLVKWFRKEKIKAMRKRNRESDFSPKELRNTCEFIVCDNYIGRTVLISNPKEYKERDRKRMHNDFIRSISIRLAKILINLSWGKNGKKLLDPFCGVGVLLEESVYEKIECIGIEIDDKIRLKAIKNLKNLGAGSDFKVIKGDSAKINKYVDKVDCVASEPYLGPYLKNRPKKEGAIKIIKELNKLYEEFFVNLKKILKKNGKVAMVFPIIIASDRKEYRLNLNKILEESGFKISKLDDVDFPIPYNEKKGVIGREIYVLE
jgi:tRNA G10  N-methylase Trm11